MSVLAVIAFLSNLLKHSTKQSSPVRTRCCNEGRRLPNPRVADVVNPSHTPDNVRNPQYDSVNFVGPRRRRGETVFVVDALAQHVPQFGGRRRVPFPHVHVLGHGEPIGQVCPCRDVVKYHRVWCVDKDVVLHVADVACFGDGRLIHVLRPLQWVV